MTGLFFVDLVVMERLRPADDSAATTEHVLATAIRVARTYDD